MTILGPFLVTFLRTACILESVQDFFHQVGHQTTNAHWASYVVGGITQLKVKILLDFAKSQIAEENSKVCASDL